ncbi:MAG: hypothetical protein Q8O22_02340, partial [Candidatus Omnitrophota bacterium]|nr:hypothetical protein [Candidatus Omnitrophota bacterium]
INEIIKQAGLSLPIGRRSEKVRTAVQQSAPQPVSVVPVGTAQCAVPTQSLMVQPVEPPPTVITPQPPVGTGLKPVPTESVAEAAVPASQPAVGTAYYAVPTQQITILEGETLSGPALLKAMDYILGGSYSFNALIDSKLQRQNDTMALTEGLIYFPLFEQGAGFLSALWPLINRKLLRDDINSYLTLLQPFTSIPSDIARSIPNLLQEARSIKMDLSDGSSIYLDGQFRTIWSTQYLPCNFSTSLYNLRVYINKYIYENSAFNLFMAPGNESCSKEFFDFLAAMNSWTKKIKALTIYGNNMEEIRTIPVQQGGELFFIFGLWPWQYTDCRAIKKLGEFRPFFFEPLAKEFMVASVEVELSQPIDNQKVSLRGCVLKSGATGKICMIILSNLPSQKAEITDLAASYLKHWPNLSESFQDFNQKVEFFTYVGSSRPDIKLESVGLNQDSSDIKQVLSAYLQILDIYLKRNFLPVNYDNIDFPEIKERFYHLKAVLKEETGFISITFQLPPDYPYRNDLEYICCRLNEREIKFSADMQTWFRVD